MSADFDWEAFDAFNANRANRAMVDTDNLCTDGAPDDEHTACLKLFGQCPHCGAHD